MSTDKTYREKTIAQCTTFLSRWSNASALMRELTVSHRTLRIVLTEVDRPGNLVISCLDPIRIKGPVRWEKANLSVSGVALPDGDGGFLLVDPSAELEVLCGAIEVSENVKLW